MIVDKTNGALEEARKFADEIGMREQFEDKIKYLHTFGGSEFKCRCELTRDFAPHSFGWLLFHMRNGEWTPWMNGGLIFHGAHDNGGDGGAPTYSVSLERTEGWGIHS